MWQDVVNACLELAAVSAMLASCKQLVRDKRVRGVHPWAVFYSVLSASWFTYYYAHLDQWWSFWCALGYFAATLTWASMAFYYFASGVICRRDPEL